MRAGYNPPMKIVQLDIQGFRSLKNVSWRPGDLNVIIGPNGSGKSNLLRMLEMISAAAQGRLSRFIQAEGGFGAVLWDGQAESIKFSVAMSQMHTAPPTPLEVVEVIPDHPTTPPRFAYNIELLPSGKGASYRVGQEQLQD